MRYLFKTRHACRLLSAVCLSVFLSGCFQVQLNGPVGGATVTLAEAAYPDNILQTTVSNGENELISALGAQHWAEMGPRLKLLFLGTADFDTSGLGDDTLYLLTATGGADYDYNADGIPDEAPTPVDGSWHALLTGKQLKSDLAKVSLLTETLYRVAYATIPDISRLSGTDGIQNRLDLGASPIVGDLNNDGMESYDDVTAWSSVYNRSRYLGDEQALTEYAAAIANDEWPTIGWVTNRILGSRRTENVRRENPDLFYCGNWLPTFTHEVRSMRCSSDGYTDPEGDLSGIEAFSELRMLGLGELVYLQDEDFDLLQQLPKLETLSFPARLTPEAGLPSREALDALASFPALRCLELNQSTFRSYDWLAALEDVETVSWNIPTEHLESAFEALTAMPGLVELNLKAAELTAAQLARLTELTGLRRLYLGPNYLNLDLTALPVLPELESLTIPARDVSNLEALAAYTNLRYLDLPFAEVRDLSPLLGLMKLEYLNLSGSPVEDWSGVGALSSLQFLNASFTGLSSLEHFHSLSSLDELNVASNPIVSLEGIESLGNLRVLNISDTQLTNLDLAANIPNLEELNAGQIGLTSVQGIQGAPSLKRLSLWRNQLTTTEGIRQLPALKYLDLTENSLVAIPGLAELPAIKEIYLFENPGIPCAELFALREALAGRAKAYTPDCTP